MIKKVYFDFNDWKKVKYFKLMIYARLMKLIIPIEWYDVQITDDDVIERIIEFRNDEIKWINENSYIYGGCLINAEKIKSLLSDLEIDKICDFYLDIIKKEFGDGKILIK